MLGWLASLWLATEIPLWAWFVIGLAGVFVLLFALTLVVALWPLFAVAAAGGAIVKFYSWRERRKGVRS